MNGSRSRRRSRKTSTTQQTAIATNPILKTVQGGIFTPLNPQQIQSIQQAVLEILATIGMSEAPSTVIEKVCAAGGKLDQDNRLLFPKSLVEQAITELPKTFTLHGQQPRHELNLGGNQVYTGTGGAAPMIIDLHTGKYRDSTLADLYDSARLVDTLEHVHFFSRSLVARDMPDDKALDINTAFASLLGTRKHVMTSASHPDHIAAIAEMCYQLAGSEQAFRDRPFLSLNMNHVVPPLRFATQDCEVMIRAIECGIPIMMNTFGQLGASSPVTIVGSIAQTLAETLAGMVIAWLIDPQAKTIFGPRPMVTDLRTGAMSGGGGEQALATATVMQVARAYGFATSTIAGATDSKLADVQSGYEKALSITLAAHAGCNLITQACGMHAGLMAVSLESYVIDNDMLGSILRSMVPVEVSPETLSVNMINEVIRGEGHFLGHPDTYQRMKSDFVYPQLADRRTPAEWEQAGSPDLQLLAKERVLETLRKPAISHWPLGLEDKIRTEFDIRLDPIGP